MPGVVQSALADDGAKTIVKIASSTSSPESSSYEDFTEQLSLEAGVWLLTASVRWNASVASPRVAKIRLYNVTDDSTIGTEDVRLDSDTGDNSHSAWATRVVDLASTKTVVAQQRTDKTSGSTVVGGRDLYAIRLVEVSS